MDEIRLPDVVVALERGQEVIWSGKAELHNGMLCGYMGDPKERIEASDQIVTVYVAGKKNGGRDE